MSCKWDRDQKAYLRDGEPCKVDDYGDPTRHCQGKGCSNHIGHGELTCARCVGDVRGYIRAIVELAPLMLPAALAGGVNSEAAMLAGPATDAEAWSWRKIAAKQGLIWHASLLEEDDEHHPYSVLTRWEFMLREDYDAPRYDATSVISAAEYLLRNLHRVAQDDEQDFPLLRDEMRTCRDHLQAVIHNSHKPEKGAPCPDCKDEGRVVRLTRTYGHWCEAEDCAKLHYADTSDDWWVCPRNRDHRRSHEDYTRWIEERAASA